MNKKAINRKNILSSLIKSLNPLKYTIALWEQGAASFGRTDRWSDIDLMLVVDDKKVGDAFKVIEKALGDVSKIDRKFRIPEPAWHGLSQCFYTLKDASPFLFIDICVIKKSIKDKFLQFRIHGKPLVYFDKSGIVKDDPVDKGAMLKKMRGRIETMKVTFPMLQMETLKELNRGNDVEAFSFYLGNTFRPLVEILGIKHRPYHYNFHTRYVYYEFPKDVIERLEKLVFVPDARALRKARDDAEIWFWETMRSIDIKEVKALLDGKP